MAIKTEIFRFTQLRKVRPRIVRRAFLRISTVQCTDAEHGALLAISAEDLEYIAKNLLLWTRTSQRHARPLRAICFGAAAAATYAPEWARIVIDKDLGGMWCPAEKVIIVRFIKYATIEDVIIHETAHALLDTFCHFFHFPLTIKEGFACQAQMLVSGKRGIPKWMGKAANGRLTPEQYVSIRDLLLFDYSKNRKSDDRAFAQAFSRLTRASYWLAGFLLEIGRSLEDGSVLAYLRRRNITEPLETLAAICTVAHLSETELEKRFQQFCMEPEDGFMEGEPDPEPPPGKRDKGTADDFTTLFDVDYGHDAVGNPLFRPDGVDSTRSELYGWVQKRCHPEKVSG